MWELTLRSVVDDWDGCRRHLEGAGATLVFAGDVLDRYFDRPGGDLASQDERLRLRLHRAERVVRAELAWRGPSSLEHGLKLREELAVQFQDGREMARILTRLGFQCVCSVEREVAQYLLDTAMVRFERFACMDDLVEVEGSPAHVERAIRVLGMPRSAFSAETLGAFVERFEQRTGQRAALAREPQGERTVHGQG